MLWGPEKIRELLAQRHEMEQLSGILLCSPEEYLGVGFKAALRAELFQHPGRHPAGIFSPPLLPVAAEAPAKPVEERAGFHLVFFQGVFHALQQSLAEQERERLQAELSAARRQETEAREALESLRRNCPYCWFK